MQSTSERLCLSKEDLDIHALLGNLAKAEVIRGYSANVSEGQLK